VTFGSAATYDSQMTAKHGLWILAVAVLAGAGSGCATTNSSGSNTTSTATAPADALQFPPSTPAWIVAAATTTAESLEDAHAKVVSVSLGRHPIVVLAGTFTCTLCSRPGNSTAAQTGTYAAIRYEAATRRGTDFGLADSEQQAISGLCNGSPCTAARNR
jgi:hypothetical protein